MPAKRGDTVRVHYTGTLQDGTEFDSSRGKAPLEFTLGAGRVIPGFDAAVSGMEVGETRTVTIPADDAYGARNDAMLLRVPREKVPPNVDPRVGQQLQVGRGNEAVNVVVREVTPEHVVLDANHPLAGEDLTFALELVSCEPTT
jgi:peptidylprolyl isomerase